MSVLKLLDTNTVMEPIRLCLGGKEYRVDNGQMIKYSVVVENGERNLYLNGEKVLPLIEMKK